VARIDLAVADRLDLHGGHVHHHVAISEILRILGDARNVGLDGRKTPFGRDIELAQRGTVDLAGHG